MVLSIRRGFVCCACVVGWTMIAPALSESDSFFKRNRNHSVTERPRPDYEAEPIQLGAFGIRPVLRIDLGYDDNVYANDANPEADFVSRFDASTQIKARWHRHRLAADAYVIHNQYAIHLDESTTGFGVGGSGGTDINRNISIEGGGYVRWGHEPRISPNQPNQLARPIAYRRLGGYIHERLEFRRVRLISNTEYTHLDYQNGVLVNGDPSPQDRRDRHRGKFMLRGDYALSPDSSVFVRTAWQGIYFIHPDGENSKRSNSNDFMIDTGIDLDLTNTIRGQLSIGYISRFLDRAGPRNLHGLGFEANLDWFATSWLTVWLEGQRQYVLSELSASPASLETGGRIGTDYEFRPNIILSGQVGYLAKSYVDSDRNDGIISGELAANWLVNRYLTLSLNYSPGMQTSSGNDAGRQYTKHAVFLALKTSH